MALGFIAGLGSLLTGDQDIESIWTGGETSEEQAIREDQLRALENAYRTAEGYERKKYLGPTGDKVAELQNLREAYNSPMWSSAPGDIEARTNLKTRIAQLEDEVEQEMGYTPDYYAPTTEYDISGYDPTKVMAQSESAWAALNPDRYAAPGYEGAAMQDPSEAAKARADAESLLAAKGALGSIEDVYQQGGLTAADRARIEQIQRENAMEARASREAIMGDLAARGMATSGNRVVALMNAAQNAANRNNAMGLGVEQLAEQRALNAMRDAGVLGRGLANDEFSRQFQTGSAADEINRFNTIGARDVEADQRRAADEYAVWQRGMLGRDVDRLTGADVYNADAQTASDLYRTDRENEMNRWGAGEQNRAGMINTANQTNANRYQADQAWNQLMGYNTQQGNIGGMKLGQAGAYNTIQGSRPTADWGQAVNNMWNLDQAIGNEVQQWIPWTSMGSNIPGGGGSGGSNNMNPLG